MQTAERPILEYKLLTGFSDFEKKLNGSKEEYLEKLRKDAMSVFERLGFPTVKNEDWRYTSLSNLVKREWKEADKAAPLQLSKDTVMSFFIENLQANHLVFINGRYSKEHSVIIEKDTSIIIGSFAEALKSHPALVESHFARYAVYEHSATVALNTALAADGAFMYVPKGKALQHPVYIVAISGHEEDALLVQQRNLIVLEENAEAKVIEASYSAGSQPSWSNIVTEVSVAANARMDYFKVQMQNELANQVNLTQFEQLQDSLCNSYTFTLGGKMVRNDLNYHLSAPHCESHLYGLYLPGGEEHFDNHSFMDHAVPNCYSNEIYKGIMLDRSTAVFNGKILVRQDAQKTNAYQSNKNVLLSAEAKVDTKPQLEIFADDVKCSHGATVGQLDEEAVFYLRSRGIEAGQARRMLTYAFAEEVMEQIKIEPLKTWLEEHVQQKLAAF